MGMTHGEGGGTKRTLNGRMKHDRAGRVDGGRTDEKGGSAKREEAKRGETCGDVRSPPDGAVQRTGKEARRSKKEAQRMGKLEWRTRPKGVACDLHGGERCPVLGGATEGEVAGRRRAGG
eukprot:64600-Chlamydomonas_euryale.AAC.1